MVDQEVVVVTGAGRGLGKAVTETLSREHNCPVLAISRSGHALQQLVGKGTGTIGEVRILAIDLTAPNAPAQALNSLNGAPVKALICNHGLLINRAFTEITTAEQESLFQVNVLSTMALVQGLLPALEKSRAAHIVTIGSMGGVQGSAKFKGLAAYSASKAALAVLTECLAEELRERNIRANCLALGAVDTEMLRLAFPGYTAATSALEMARFVSYFALHGHQWFNGKVVPVATSVP
jgi:3-oxoacyl-[acyl-carrier protein] reductase